MQINGRPFLTIPYFIDIMQSGVWATIQETTDPELMRLAKELPETVLKARADSTTKKYLGAYARWKRWASERESVATYPISTTQFALYLQHVGESTKSRAAVEEAVNAISWVQRLAGDQAVNQHSLIKMTVDGFQRTLARPKVRKEPVTPEMLQEIVAAMSSPPTLSEVRLAAICLLAYAGFLRFDELQKLRCCDVVFSEGKMELSITSSKTDQFRQGAVVPIAQTDRQTCPVAMLKKYFELGKLDISSEQRLFRAVCKTKRGESLRATGSLSYTRMRELVRGKIQELGYDERVFGMHSFRAGGATAAANNPSIPERHFKRHGRWRSEGAKDGYIKDSEESRLNVSKGLGM